MRCAANSRQWRWRCVYLTDAMIKKYKRIVCLVPEDGVRLNMKQEGLTAAAIDKFFHLIANEEAQKK